LISRSYIFLDLRSNLEEMKAIVQIDIVLNEANVDGDAHLKLAA